MTFPIGRTARRSPLPGIIAIVTLGLALTACGVKNDLSKPNGQTTSKDASDPSKPPYPLGR